MNLLICLYWKRRKPTSVGLLLSESCRLSAILIFTTVLVKMSRFVIAIDVLVLSSCKTTGVDWSQFYNDTIPLVSFCDLPKYKDQQLYLKAYYTGIDEYWSLTLVARKKCTPELRVDLQFAESCVLFGPPEQYQSVFDEVHNNYRNSYLMIPEHRCDLINIQNWFFSLLICWSWYRGQWLPYRLRLPFSAGVLKRVHHWGFVRSARLWVCL